MPGSGIKIQNATRRGKKKKSREKYQALENANETKDYSS